MMRLRTAILAALVGLAVSGCHLPGHGSYKPHPHGAPPGQVKKLFKCGTCGITRDAIGTCHGRTTVEVYE